MVEERIVIISLGSLGPIVPRRELNYPCLQNDVRGDLSDAFPEDTIIGLNLDRKLQFVGGQQCAWRVLTGPYRLVNQGNAQTFVDAPLALVTYDPNGPHL